MSTKEIIDVCQYDYYKFLNRKNVVGVCLGNKQINGSMYACPCITVLVSKKIPKSLLSVNDLVPSYYNGITTDVVEVGVIEATALTAKVRPVLFGYSIGPYNQSWAGTAGALVSDGTTKYILSNNHVLAGSNALPLGTGILQPSLIDGGVQATDVVANLTKYVPILFETATSSPINYVDAAIATVTNPAIFSKNIALIGSVAGVVSPSLRLKVQKSGRTTELTNGRITGLNGTVRVNYGSGKTALFANQIITSSMSAPGDSGSLVLDERRRAVGLLFAGSNTITILNPISTVLTALGVKLVV